MYYEITYFLSSFCLFLSLSLGLIEWKDTSEETKKLVENLPTPNKDTLAYIILHLKRYFINSCLFIKLIIRMELIVLQTDGFLSWKRWDVCPDLLWTFIYLSIFLSKGRAIIPTIQFTLEKCVFNRIMSSP